MVQSNTGHEQELIAAVEFYRNSRDYWMDAFKGVHHAFERVPREWLTPEIVAAIIWGVDYPADDLRLFRFLSEAERNDYIKRAKDLLRRMESGGITYPIGNPVNTSSSPDKSEIFEVEALFRRALDANYECASHCFDNPESYETVRARSQEANDAMIAAIRLLAGPPAKSREGSPS